MSVRRDIALAGLVGVFLSGLAALGGGFGAWVGGGDLFGMYLSKHRYVAEALAAGRFPLWNPYEYTGAPLHGLSQGSVLYLPVAFANLVAEPIAALQILYHLHILAYVLLVVVYLARAGIGPAGRGLGALLAVGCFFNGLALVGNDHPLTLFPLPFLVASLIAWDAYMRGRQIALPVIALLLAIQWLPGYPALAMDACLILPLVALLTPGRPLVRRTGVAVALVGFGALLAAVQLLPLAEAGAESARSDWAGDFALRRSLFAARGAGPFLADLLRRYGAAGVLLLGLGLLHPQRARPAWAAVLVLCFFATNRPLSLLYEIPPFAMQQHAWGWDLIEPLFVGCTAASGVEWLRERREGWTGLAAPALAATLAAVALLLDTPLEAALAAACALCTAPPVRRRAGWLVVVAIATVHVGGVMSRVGTAGLREAPDLEALEPRAEQLRTLRARQPERPRIVSPVELYAGQLLPERLPSPTGYEPAIPPRRIYRLNERLGLGLYQMGFEWPRTAAAALAAHPGAGAAMGVGLVVVSAGRGGGFHRAGFTPVGRLPGGDVVLHRRAAPRFQLLHAAWIARDGEESLDRILAPDFEPAREVVLEGPLGSQLAPAPAGAFESVRLVSETPEHIRLRVEAASAGVLVIADTWYPGWEARVDGRPVPILRANYAFRAVALDAGARDVDLRYRPLSFRVGLGVSGAGVLALLVLVLLARRADRAGATP